MSSIENVSGALNEIADETDGLVDGPMAAMDGRLEDAEPVRESIDDHLDAILLGMSALGTLLDEQRVSEVNVSASLRGLQRRTDQVSKGTDDSRLRRSSATLGKQAEDINAGQRAAVHQELLSKAGNAIEEVRLAIGEIVTAAVQKRQAMEQARFDIGSAASDIRDAAGDM